MFNVKKSFLVIFYLLGFKLRLSGGQGRELLVKDLNRNANYAVLCKLQPDKYDCNKRGLVSHGFYYDIKMEDCKTSVYGTCRDNFNKFSTLSECHEQCRGVGLEQITANLSKEVICRLQPDFGYCNDYHPMWYFDISQRICRGFSFSGCGGNLNRFHTAQMCTAHCATVLYDFQ